MALAENIAERLSYKFYASPTMSSTEPAPASDPGASGAQNLRHVSHNFQISKATFNANEKRSDRNRAMGRHGMRQAPATINGLLSCGTQGDLFEASLQGTRGSAVVLSPSQLTSLSADNATSKFTAAGGDPVALGLRVGDIFTLASMSDADNNAKNFLVKSFGGTSNREITVYPAPDTMSADTSFTLTTKKALYRPLTGFVSRKAAFEVYNPEIDVARLYTEARIGGWALNLPPTDNASINFNVLGRNRVVYEATNAPFFTSPTAQTTSGILAGVNGYVDLNGSAIGVLTGLSATYAMDLRGPAVVGANGLMPDILIGEANITGQLTFLFDGNGADVLALFDDETEFGILAYLTATSAVNTPAMSFYLPRVKLNSAEESDGGDLGKIITCNYEASTYEGSTAGVQNTLIRMVDTAW